MDVLVLGGAGQVGLDLQPLAAGLGLSAVTPARAGLDLLDPAAIREAVAARPWACVINCAAYANPSAPMGTFHFANAGETTWCGLARETLALSAARGGPSVPVEAITTGDYPTPARQLAALHRPHHGRIRPRATRLAYGARRRRPRSRSRKDLKP